MCQDGGKRPFGDSRPENKGILQLEAVAARPAFIMWMKPGL